MAVVRVTLTKNQHLTAQRLLHADPELRRAAREFGRAAERPGLTAELTGPEVRGARDYGGWPPAMQEAFDQAVRRIEATEEYERSRPRARDVALAAMALKRLR